MSVPSPSEPGAQVYPFWLTYSDGSTTLLQLTARIIEDLSFEPTDLGIMHVAGSDTVLRGDLVCRFVEEGELGLATLPESIVASDSSILAISRAEPTRIEDGDLVTQRQLLTIEVVPAQQAGPRSASIMAHWPDGVSRPLTLMWTERSEYALTPSALIINPGRSHRVILRRSTPSDSALAIKGFKTSIPIDLEYRVLEENASFTTFSVELPSSYTIASAMNLTIDVEFTDMNRTQSIPLAMRIIKEDLR